ncbi:NAD(P)-binding domain-containing protein [Methylovirgula sp. 4M-Z18]|uniref:NAD(P)-binding domain-containing protein n=1 Tax=Methylovirgula sp. 4M-Z18 TaxID=2293567 RepID=UPI00131424FD|nr:NAD(P)-binding domain-containing protein [Methylovirgula sp. 4M-Z18]
MDAIDVIIVGAGPYGLSLASHLHAKGVRFRIFGRLMESWKSRMPPGMYLKSHVWSSSLSDPAEKYTLGAFCKEINFPLADSDTPPLEQFVAYAEAFQQRVVPNVEGKLLTHLRSDPKGFIAEFDDGELVLAKQVIVAVGVHPFKHVPRALGGLPKEVVSHSGDYGALGGLEGRTVAVIGAGASATDLAGLLVEKGASVSLIARTQELKFAEKSRQRKSTFHHVASVIKPIIRPGSGIGSGWLLKFCADAPGLFHLLPQRLRTYVVGSQLGPLGHSGMKDRVIGKSQLFLGRELERAEYLDGNVTLHLKCAGRREIVTASHVIAATGYKIDLRRLEFLDKNLLSRVATVEGAPILSSNYESTTPGLYFIGPVAANAFGPVMRFVFGASHPSRRLAAYLAESKVAWAASSTETKPAITSRTKTVEPKGLTMDHETSNETAIAGTSGVDATQS